MEWQHTLCAYIHVHVEKVGVVWQPLLGGRVYAPEPPVFSAHVLIETVFYHMSTSIKAVLCTLAHTVSSLHHHGCWCFAEWSTDHGQHHSHQQHYQEYDVPNSDPVPVVNFRRKELGQFGHSKQWSQYSLIYFTSSASIIGLMTGPSPWRIHDVCKKGGLNHKIHFMPKRLRC